MFEWEDKSIERRSCQRKFPAHKRFYLAHHWGSLMCQADKPFEQLSYTLYVPLNRHYGKMSWLFRNLILLLCTFAIRFTILPSLESWVISLTALIFERKPWQSTHFYNFILLGFFSSFSPGDTGELEVREYSNDEEGWREKCQSAQKKQWNSWIYGEENHR